METLNPSQISEANSLDKMLKAITEHKEQLKQYKLNDIYLLEEWYQDAKGPTYIEKTSMGLPVKYKVVYISPEGIPYLRKITGTGRPSGEARTPPEANFLFRIYNAERHLNHYLDKPNYRFISDPEQLDSILLDVEFDPMAEHRNKSKMFNQINKHNKKVTIPTGVGCFQKIAEFFKSRNPGDKFWTSPEKQYIIQSVVKQGKEWMISAIDQNNKPTTFNFSYFLYKRLYYEQPRSFAKENKV